jgi:hypothetical protein
MVKSDRLCREPIPRSTRSALNSRGSMKRQILTNAAVEICGAAKRLDIGQEVAPVLLLRSSGPFDGNITVSRAANTDGAEVRVVST